MDRLKAEIKRLSLEERKDLLRWLHDLVAEEEAGSHTLEIVFDGGSQGNPGPAYGSFQISGSGIPTTLTRVDFPTPLTNNEAEYKTLIEALKKALQILDERGENPSCWTVVVRGDSRLVINQVSGDWATRSPGLLPLRQEARDLLGKFGRFHLVHHPRSQSVKVLGH